MPSPRSSRTSSAIRPIAPSSIVYNLQEGPRVYIERIDILGNIRTLDAVIRREIRLVEGDAYNRILVDRARRRLVALDFFEKIDIREDPGSAADKVVLVIEVVEKSTGSIAFSAGYSTQETVIGSITLTERNFLGRGQRISISTTASLLRQNVTFSYTEPYFLGRRVSAGIDAIVQRTDLEEEFLLYHRADWRRLPLRLPARRKFVGDHQVQFQPPRHRRHRPQQRVAGHSRRRRLVEQVHGRRRLHL